MTQIPSYDQELAARKAFCARVRLHMRDYEQLNRMVAGEEHSDRLILHAIDLALSAWNDQGPPIGYDHVYRHPAPAALLDGVTARLLESAYFLRKRGDVQYNHGATVINLPNPDAWLEASRMLWNRFLEAAMSNRTRRNAQATIAEAGGLHSLFAFTYMPMWHSLTDGRLRC